MSSHIRLVYGSIIATKSGTSIYQPSYIKVIFKLIMALLNSLKFTLNNMTCLNILEFIKCMSFSNDFQKYQRGHLAPSSHCSILIEITLASKAGQENDLSIAPK
jgi:hypothetical protein